MTGVQLCTMVLKPLIFILYANCIIYNYNSIKLLLFKVITKEYDEQIYANKFDNSDEMNKFPWTYELPILMKEIEFLDKTFPQRKLMTQMASSVILDKHVYVNST